jgi:hypothetical protein
LLYAQGGQSPNVEEADIATAKQVLLIIVERVPRKAAMFRIDECLGGIEKKRGRADSVATLARHQKTVDITDASFHLPAVVATVEQ